MEKPSLDNCMTHFLTSFRFLLKCLFSRKNLLEHHIPKQHNLSITLYPLICFISLVALSTDIIQLVNFSDSKMLSVETCAIILYTHRERETLTNKIMSSFLSLRIFILYSLKLVFQAYLDFFFKIIYPSHTKKETISKINQLNYIQDIFTIGIQYSDIFFISYSMSLFFHPLSH